MIVRTLTLEAGIDATVISYLGALRAWWMTRQSRFSGTFHDDDDLSNCSRLERNFFELKPITYN